jgi:glucose-1-phosphate thymidylyltransferase
MSTVNLAIIDATARGSGHPLGWSGSSPYSAPIANLPLIGHVFDELAASGIDQVRVIAPMEIRRELGRILGDGTSWGVEVSYRDLPEADGRETVLSEINQALATGPVLLHPGTSLFRGQVTAMRERFSAGDVDSVLPEQASIEQSDVGSSHRVSENVLVLGPETRRLFAELLSAAGEAGDLIASLLQGDYRLAVCEPTEHWRYSESTAGLLAANRMMLDALPVPPAETTFDENNQVHGRVAIDPGALVSNCVLHGPIAVDVRAVVEDSFIGPYTAIGAGAVVSGTEIDNSMVLAGAELRHPGSRIEASIIGERSRVVRSFDLPRGLHLRLGADSQVGFS